MPWPPAIRFLRLFWTFSWTFVMVSEFHPLKGESLSAGDQKTGRPDASTTCGVHRARTLVSLSASEGRFRGSRMLTTRNLASSCRSARRLEISFAQTSCLEPRLVGIGKRCRRMQATSAGLREKKTCTWLWTPVHKALLLATFG